MLTNSAPRGTGVFKTNASNTGNLFLRSTVAEPKGLPCPRELQHALNVLTWEPETWAELLPS